VFLRNRGGTGFVGQLFADSLTFTRVVDNTSQATVSIASRIPECEAVLAIAHPWKHELEIIRNGRSVWAGPVTDVSIGDRSFNLVARDLTQWFWRRTLPFDRDLELDLALIFKQFVDDAMSQDPSPNVNVDPTPIGVVGRRSVLASQYRICGTEIQELATTGLDFTALSRDILLGGIEVPVGIIPAFHTEHAELATVYRSGLQTSNQAIVIGQGAGSDGSPIVGIAGPNVGDIDEQGLLQRFFAETTIQDRRTAQLAAQTRYDLLNATPEYVTFNPAPNAPVAFNDLVPGAVGALYLKAGPVDIVGEYRLRDMNVSATPEAEIITVTYEPLGTIEVDRDLETVVSLGV
jgi:hypothetical protein